MRLEELTKWRSNPGVPKHADIIALEELHNIRFPDDYRQYLIEYNGGHFCGEVFFSLGGKNLHVETLFGMHDTVPYCELCNKENMCVIDFNDPVEIVPIGNTSKNYLILMVVARDDGNGQIILKTYDEAYEAFDSFTEFVDNLKDRVATLGW